MKVCYYIDDTLIIAASKAECSANVHKVIRLLGDLGFKINFKKCQVDPVTGGRDFQLARISFSQPFDTFNFSIVLSKRANR